MQLFHGSNKKIPCPIFGAGNPHNDYGLGFYCTPSKELACEWACPGQVDGYANEYKLDTSGLVVVDLESENYSILNWLAILVENRVFDITTPVMSAAMELMRAQYHVDLGAADIIRGYRADDSYFSFARAFLDNRISMGQLERAMKLGDLGIQITLRSKRAFEALHFIEAYPAEAVVWHPRRSRRDENARKDYRAILLESFSAEDVFVLDLLREG